MILVDFSEFVLLWQKNNNATNPQNFTKDKK